MQVQNKFIPFQEDTHSSANQYSGRPADPQIMQDSHRSMNG